ncbi:right-handed parallel beta-helix repeat-containing protein [Actinotalea caeni]|uniref:right-handed parallel beta-helix repeat-containing protein n=1 Tax=Actinotalea caeni TaxID=1348467 RepID=UPI0012E10CF0|nr:right-handed parallel beta-helix repeat-containing protein [Actinotalea caeni]
MRARRSVIARRSRGARALRRRRGASASAVAVVATLGIASLTTPAAAAGATWYVDQTSTHPDDDCGATVETACATITAALAHAEATDTVVVAAGTYTESLVIDVPITLEGAGVDAVTLTTADGSQPVVTVAADDVVLTGLTVLEPSGDEGVMQVLVRVEEGRAATLDGVALRGDPGTPLSSVGVVAADGSSLAFTNSEATDLFLGVGVGTDLSSDLGSATLSMTGSTIADNGAGVMLLAGSATIQDSEIRDNAYTGLRSEGPDASFDVTSTVISGNATTESAGTFRGGVLLYGGSFTGYDVTITDNHYGLMADSGDIELYDSTVADNGWTSEERFAGAGIWGRSSTPSDDGGEAPFTLLLENTTVSGNTVGVAAIQQAEVAIHGSAITDNAIVGLTTEGEGVGVVELELTDSQVARNGLANDDPHAPRGGVMLMRTSAVISDSDITENDHGLGAYESEVTLVGGSVSDQSSVGIIFGGSNGETLVISDTTIADNGMDPSLSEVGHIGGGVFIQAGTVTGSGLVVDGNAFGFYVVGALTLTDSVVSHSRPSDSGGSVLDDVLGSGVLAVSGPVTIVRSEISDNEYHGVILGSRLSSVALDSSTVAGNNGFGVSGNELDDPAQLVLAGSTVADNTLGGIDLAHLEATFAGSVVTGGDGPACVAGDAAPTDAGFNVVSDTSCSLGGSSLTGADPLLQPLGDNGGPTQTMLLLAGSPAVDLVPEGTSVPWDGGTIEVCGDGTDQRGPGYPRLSGAACDAGAAEGPADRIPVTVTASDATWYEGAFDPEVTPSYSGFRDGDSEADVDTPPTCGFDVDTATTFCSGAEDDVYDFVYVDGTLDVLEPLVILTESLPEATVGEPYSATLEATGGDGGPYTWGIHDGALPAGLEIDTTTGEIFGVPEAAGDVTFTVFVGDPITRELTLTVLPAAEEPEPPVDDPTEDPTDDPTENPTGDATTPPPAAGPPAGAGGDTGTGGGALPSTGADTLVGVVASALATLLGSTLTLAVRQRRRHGLG